MSRLIDADKLKSLYSKEENVIRNRLFSLVDRVPEHEEGKYKRLAEQYKCELDFLQRTLDEERETHIPIEYLEFLEDNPNTPIEYKIGINQILVGWKEQLEKEKEWGEENND